MEKYGIIYSGIGINYCRYCSALVWILIVFWPALSVLSGQIILEKLEKKGKH